MDSVEDALEENRLLRRTMRDLVALSTLPAVWMGLDPEGIVRSLSDVLLHTLSLDLIYVRLAGLDREDAVEVFRTRHDPDAGDLEAVRRAVAPVLASDESIPPISIPDPLGSGTLHVAVTRFGLGDDTGVIVSGSRNAGFPTEQDRLLLGVGANQTAIVVHQKQAEEALRESEEKLRMMADTIPQLAWMAQPDGHIFWFNRRWYEYTGTTPDQMEGWGWQSVHHPHELPKVLERWKGSIASGEPFEMVFPLRSEDGRFRPFLTRVAPLRDAEGRILYWFGTNTDISKIKKMEEALRAADRRKDEFLATLAHELRNPLAPLRNSLQILTMPRVDAAAAQHARDVMERQVQQLVRLVDDLLDASRVMRGKIELRKEPVELASVVARAVETAQPLIDGHGHELEISLAADSLLVDADPVRLAQIIGNLLTNAAKYTKASGHISLSAGREGDDAVLRVRDDGIGIAPDMLPHVFELFVQAEHATTRAQGGLGIGLTLVKNLVELHGGEVEAHSAGLGRGCEFVVRLPLRAQPRDVADEKVDSVQEVPSSGGHRILVVDDHEDSANSLAMLLQWTGHEVRAVHDGASALEAVNASPPEFIFLDIGMPGMDGYEVARRIRKTAGLEDIILVALTGWGQEEDRRRSAEAGFDHHLVKPVAFKTLEGLLAELKDGNKPVID